MKKYKSFLLFLFIIFFIQSCITRPPESPDNLCLIFKEKRNWYKAAIKSESRWEIPPYVLMSFVFQESSYKADARPEREKLFGFIPWSRPSSAYGYSQALTNTWEDYKNETGNSLASRRNFSDSADFIGWYASKGYSIGFKKNDAKSLYLAYHEGYSGYQRKTYRNKQWLIQVANRVQAKSSQYQRQYMSCEKDLKRKKFIFFG